MILLNSLVLILSIACCLRIMFYQRNGARFKRAISLLAWFGVVISGGTAIKILTGNLNVNQLHPLLVFALIVTTVILFFSRGNVAHAFRVTTSYRSQDHEPSTTLDAKPKR